MGLTAPKIYLDSCIVIYLVEEHPEFAPVIESMLEDIPTADLVISGLTVMECLVSPIRTENRPLEDKFLNWFTGLTVLPVTNGTFIEAANLRAANTALKTPDAIHLATALHYHCDEFWTNDERLNKVAATIVRNILR